MNYSRRLDCNGKAHNSCISCFHGSSFHHGLSPPGRKAQRARFAAQLPSQTGALIPGAQVALSGYDGKTISTTTGRDGAYHFSAIAPGTYQMVVTAKGFADAAMGVQIDSGKLDIQDVKMQLPVERQQVTVTDDAVGVSTAADANTSAIVIKGKDLDALSDDPDELQNELNALPDPPPAPTAREFFIDGFRGGQLPPKSSIREICINQSLLGALRQARLRPH